jgi:glycosyltransferase involved in cell wall biosynthesis
MLHRFWTGFALASDSPLRKLLPKQLQQRIRNRVMDIPQRRLRTLLMLDWRARRAAKSVGEETAFFERNRVFQESIPDAEFLSADTVIGFDTSSWILAQRAKRAERPFVLDQSIGHPAAKEKVFQMLRERFPEWSESAPKKQTPFLQAEAEEHDLATHIVAPSEFVKTTLAAEGVDRSKVHVIPFGTDLDLFSPPTKRSGGQSGQPVIFLFVGGLTARKGLPVLLAAWQELSPQNAELWLVGSGKLPATEELPHSVKVLGPKGREDVASLMRAADVFVFPSFFEGLAQVQIEAMATGLPVIGTRESGATELVVEDETGSIVEAGNILALAESINRLAGDFQLRQQMQFNAIAKRDSLSWAVYGNRWASLLRSL